MRGSEMYKVLIAYWCALTLAGCADDPGPREASTPSAPTPFVSRPSATPDHEERWIAVIDVASDPSDLDTLTQRLLDPLGSALMVAPTQCFGGLPDDAGDGYVIGAVGDSRRGVERRVADAGEEVAFSANVTILCSD
jgi:formylmethanofuran:tetrahydromethanopterin formyltransferase